MSSDKRQLKRLKQSTISMFFGSPTEKVDPDCLSQKQDTLNNINDNNINDNNINDNNINDNDNNAQDGNSQIPNSIVASGENCMTTSNQTEMKLPKANNATENETATTGEAVSETQSSFNRKTSQITKKVQQCSFERAGLSDHFINDDDNNEPQCSADVRTSNVVTVGMSDKKNSVDIRPKTNESVFTGAGADLCPLSESEERSSNLNAVGSNTRTTLPLDLGQRAGSMPANLIRFPRDAVWRPGDLKSSAEHTVLFQTPFVAGETCPPKPWPSNFTDVWDQCRVKMPNSSHSLYADANGRQTPRWQRIQAALVGPIRSFADLKEAILSYNRAFDWDLEELEDVIEEMSRAERLTFFDSLLPAIVKLALRTPELCTIAPPLLRKGRTHSLSISQQQVATLLACAFFSMFPRRNLTKPGSQFYEFPSINFHTLFNRCYRPKRRACRKQKIRCLLSYFQQVTDKPPEGTITFSRIKLCCNLGWEECQEQFQKAFITSNGLIEDQGHGMLMVDFANRKVGGGVLRDGCVQEEILCLIYPELICARLFTEALDDDDALLVTGVQRFNQYEGYGESFKWTGNVTDCNERDGWGRKYTQIVAIDALAHQGKRQQRQQFSMENILRELIKAFCGFQTPGFPRSCIATGNWGCGAFGGDPRLKFLLQWMAASRAGRQLTYFTAGNHELMCELRALQALILEQNIKIGDLCLLLKQYDRLYISNETDECPILSEYLFRNFSLSDSE